MGLVFSPQLEPRVSAQVLKPLRRPHTLFAPAAASRPAGRSWPHTVSQASELQGFASPSSFTNGEQHKSAIPSNGLLRFRGGTSATGQTERARSGHPSRTTEDTVLQICIAVDNRLRLGTATLSVLILDREGNSSLGETAARFRSVLWHKDQECTVSIAVPGNFSVLGAAVLSLSLTPGHTPSSVIFVRHLTISDPVHGQQVVWCQSWVAPGHGERTFFRNEAYLPDATPPGLHQLRAAELASLRGEAHAASNIQQAERRQPERIYAYQTYNDFSSKYDPGSPDDVAKHGRPTLGGSTDFPYPRRIRTGRPCIPGTDAETPATGDPYLPRDEQFLPDKQGSFLKGNLRAFVPVAIENLPSGRGQRTFASITDVAGLYRDTWQMLRQWLRFGGLSLQPKQQLSPRLPLVLKGSTTAWDSDREFGRQVLAGMHPCHISAVTSATWTDKRSSISDQHLQGLLGSTASIQEALSKPAPSLFCIDHVDIFLAEMPGTGKSVAACINGQPDRVQYAARCLLHLSEAGILLPVAVELIHPDRPDQPRVITPNDHPGLWRLAKAHFLVADGSWHQFVSHWLRCHVCTEPYILAARRQLSVMHPVMKALHPHFKDTMQADAFARKSLFNAGGKIEAIYNAGPYAMRFSSLVYGRWWRFDRQGLPADLISRGMAVPAASGTESDSSSGSFTWRRQQYTCLLGADYPYAADGLLIWNALREWFHSYLSLYYTTDAEVASDRELTAWWREVQDKGHADKRDGWLPLRTLEDLCDILTTIAWVSTGHHAAVNYGQFDYAGFMPNYPTNARQPLPEPGSQEETAFLQDPEAFLLDSLPNKSDAMQVMAVAQALSTHDADEEYLGMRHDEDTWTSGSRVRELKSRFQAQVENNVQKVIQQRNANSSLKHRYVNYELQLPFLPPELQGQHVSPCSSGVPNSVSL